MRGRVAVVYGCVDLSKVARWTTLSSWPSVVRDAENVLAGKRGWQERILAEAMGGTGTSLRLGRRGDAGDCRRHEGRVLRVREMAAKVVRSHCLGEALEAVARLRDDPYRECGPRPSAPIVAITNVLN